MSDQRRLPGRGHARLRKELEELYDQQQAEKDVGDLLEDCSPPPDVDSRIRKLLGLPPARDLGDPDV